MVLRKKKQLEEISIKLSTGQMMVVLGWVVGISFVLTLLSFV